MGLWCGVLVLDTVLGGQDSELIRHLVLVLQKHTISKKLPVKLMGVKDWGCAQWCQTYILPGRSVYIQIQPPHTHINIHTYAEMETQGMRRQAETGIMVPQNLDGKRKGPHLGSL